MDTLRIEAPPKPPLVLEAVPVPVHVPETAGHPGLQTKTAEEWLYATWHLNDELNLQELHRELLDQKVLPAIRQAIRQLHRQLCTSSAECPLSKHCMEPSFPLARYDVWKLQIYKELAPQDAYLVTHFAQPSLEEEYQMLYLRAKWHYDQIRAHFAFQNADKQTFTGMTCPSISTIWKERMRNRLVNNKQRYEEAARLIHSNAMRTNEKMVTQWYTVFVRNMKQQ